MLETTRGTKTSPLEQGDTTNDATASQPPVRPNGSLDQLPQFSRRRRRSRNPDNSSSSNHRSLSWPHFSAVAGVRPRSRNSMFDSHDNFVVVEDQTSKWNLDIETGQIEQDVAGAPSTTRLGKEIESNQGGRQNCWTTILACCGAQAAVNQIEEAGGDFPSRAGEALRAALGSCIFFSALVFPDPAYLGAIWIGNIFYHSSLKGNMGEALQAARGFATSIILTTLISWPVAYFLGHVSTMVAQTTLPFLTFGLSLLIMTCPWLTSPNLMILVMYVVIAAPVRFDSTTWWEPIGYMGSYLIGLGMAPLMHLIPIVPPAFRPNTATRQVHNLMEGLSKDFFLLFVQTRHYTYSTGQTPNVARAAGAAIEVLVTRMSSTIQELKRLLPSVEKELGCFRCGNHQHTNKMKQLDSWIQVAEALVTDMKLLRCALNSRFLGEQENENSTTITMSTRYIRRIIANELGQDYHQFIDSLIHLSVACNRRADPTTDYDQAFDTTQLSDSLDKTRKAFGKAVQRVTRELQTAKHGTDPVRSSTIPVFAHLARRSTSTNSLLSIAEALLEYCEAQEAIVQDQKSQPQEGEDGQKYDGQRLSISSRFCFAVCQYFPAKEIFKACWKPKWLWRDPQKRRLALKTALGMMFASLWIAIPQLWEISKPFGLWPGLTVASVNLATTGSSFHKAIDRLVGTLFAAAYALLVVEFCSGSQDTAKVPAITLFTFVVIYLKKDDHAYQYSYAATSIGSMLYGSVKVEFNVLGYIPQRIQLIFVGVITFALIELFLFPKSSRLVVEKKILQYFELMQTFLESARDFARAMQEGMTIDEENDEMQVSSSRKLSSGGMAGLPSETTRMLDELIKTEGVLRSSSVTLKNELRSALLEPYFGFSQKLHSQSMNGMVSEIGESETQALLLVKALKMVAAYAAQSQDQSGIVVQKAWPCAYATFLDLVAEQMAVITNNISSAFPDGHFRPQGKNTLRAITAAASFRDLRDVRFNIISKWSEQFQESAASASVDDPSELIVMGITTSFILELCRHLQLAGRRMEWSASHFPTR